MEKNLQKTVSEKTKVKVRFPNEATFSEISINMADFKPEIEFKDETFGWLKDTYVSISKN